jgi:putative ABC transport system ATP-binding protein
MWSKIMVETIIIDLHGVGKTFEGPAGPIHALRDVDLRVYPGEFVGVRGPSGSGKSTLINMITGIDRPTRGEIHVTGAHLNDLNENQLARWRGKNVGVIFQFFQLLPTLTVIENVMLPMDFCRVWKPRERPERAMHLLDQVGLADQAQKFPNTLSGGQQQRAAIARAISNDPPLVMGDEPTGNLDSKSADKVFCLFEDFVKQGKTFVMVTHDQGLASRIPRVIEVLDGELFDNGYGRKPDEGITL